MSPWGRDRPRWALFVGAAALLHLATVLGFRQSTPQPPLPAERTATAADDEIEIQEYAPTAAATALSANDAPQTSPRRSATPRLTAPVAPPETAEQPSARVVGLAAAADADAGHALPAPETPPETAPPLSLADLGVGAENRFVTPGAAAREAAPAARERRRAREVGRERFQRSIATEIALADQAVGLGPEGPVLGAVERATRTENPEPTSQAVFDFSTDASGKLVRVALVSSTSDPVPWRRVGTTTARALGATRLKVPKTGYGVTIRVRIVSRAAMPSGADPGLSVNVLGIPIKKGRGPRSARVDILNVIPEISTEEEKLGTGESVSVPKVKLGSLLSVMGDLSDIGAKPALQVRAHVERLTLNEH